MVLKLKAFYDRLVIEGYCIMISANLKVFKTYFGEKINQIDKNQIIGQKTSKTCKNMFSFEDIHNSQ